MDEFQDVLETVQSKIVTHPALIAIDGRCASGKTTLARAMQQRWQCNVVHVDDFYLPFSRRTPARMAAPGGNIDRERLLREVLLPLRSGRSVFYRAYDCHTDGYSEKQFLDAAKDTVVEGSYSCHPELREAYDVSLFLTVPEEEQLRRIEKRNGDGIKRFREEWIPREEAYFSAFAVKEHCDFCFATAETRGKRENNG